MKAALPTFPQQHAVSQVIILHTMHLHQKRDLLSGKEILGGGSELVLLSRQRRRTTDGVMMEVLKVACQLWTLTATISNSPQLPVSFFYVGGEEHLQALWCIQGHETQRKSFCDHFWFHLSCQFTFHPLTVSFMTAQPGSLSQQKDVTREWR